MTSDPDDQPTRRARLELQQSHMADTIIDRKRTYIHTRVYLLIYMYLCEVWLNRLMPFGPNQNTHLKRQCLPAIVIVPGKYTTYSIFAFSYIISALQAITVLMQ